MPVAAPERLVVAAPVEFAAGPPVGVARAAGTAVAALPAAGRAVPVAAVVVDLVDSAVAFACRTWPVGRGGLWEWAGHRCVVALAFRRPCC